jgi:hypothetical protein
VALRASRSSDSSLGLSSGVTLLNVSLRPDGLDASPSTANAGAGAAARQILTRAPHREPSARLSASGGAPSDPGQSTGTSPAPESASSAGVTRLPDGTSLHQQRITVHLGAPAAAAAMDHPSRFSPDGTDGLIPSGAAPGVLPAGPTSGSSPYAPRNLRFLVVDDSAANRSSLILVLRRRYPGAAFDQAKDGEEAVQLVQSALHGVYYGECTTLTS